VSSRSRCRDHAPRVWEKTSRSTPAGSITRRSTTASATTKSNTATPSLRGFHPRVRSAAAPACAAGEVVANTETGSVAARMAASQEGFIGWNSRRQEEPKAHPSGQHRSGDPSKRIHGSSRRIRRSPHGKIRRRTAAAAKYTASTRVGFAVKAGTIRAVASMAPPAVARMATASGASGHGASSSGCASRYCQAACGSAAAFRRRSRLRAPT